MITQWDISGTERKITYNSLCKVIVISLDNILENHKDAGITPDRILLTPSSYAMLTAVLNYEDQNEELVLPRTYKDIPITVTDKLREDVAFEVVIPPDEEFRRIL
ncbi:hypothetical protein SP15_204 [Bacillus phage SP-15]|uniref:Uncharacterized protein n=1 Tax=Bacillus phage SP-15 TaxID=1792032 RepID=A0A127AXT0_9CAUD|nr:hypothetical protein SP15_204 [Bacillus phage SP-15]AMM45004.1 hypothetical protein SP15_204 [Bacillus phage SP-15]